jgi:hypothetical protein
MNTKAISPIPKTPTQAPITIPTIAPVPIDLELCLELLLEPASGLLFPLVVGALVEDEEAEFAVAVAVPTVKRYDSVKAHENSCSKIVPTPRVVGQALSGRTVKATPTLSKSACHVIGVNRFIAGLL